MKGRKPYFFQRTLGFTLVEILIALTLFSFILVLIFSTLHSTSRSWQTGEKKIAANDEQRLELAFIRKHISQAIPLTRIDGKDNRILFKGESEAVHFISRLPAHRGGGGLYLVSLVVSEQDLRKGFSLMYQPVGPDIDAFDLLDSDKIKTVELIADIEAIEFSYFGRETIEDDPRWHEQWDIKDRLPELITVEITETESGRYWPELFIPMRTQNVKGQPQLTIHAPKTFDAI